MNIDDLIKGTYDFRIDIGKLLDAFSKFEISPKKRDRYSITGLSVENGGNRGYDKIWNWNYESPRHAIYMDAPLGFALMYQKKPCAAVTFGPLKSIESLDDEFLIYQLQGIRTEILDEDGLLINAKSTRSLYPLDYRALLVHVVSEFGRKNEISRIGIKSADNVVLYSPVFTYEIAHRIYDEFAISNDFVKGTDGNWHKKIVPS